MTTIRTPAVVAENNDGNLHSKLHVPPGISEERHIQRQNSTCMWVKAMGMGRWQSHVSCKLAVGQAVSCECAASCTLQHTSLSARTIFQSSRESPGMGTASLVRCGLPSVLTYVTAFSVYAGAGKITFALSAPLSPWWPCTHKHNMMVSVNCAQAPCCKLSNQVELIHELIYETEQVERQSRLRDRARRKS